MFAKICWCPDRFYVDITINKVTWYRIHPVTVQIFTSSVHSQVCKCYVCIKRVPFKARMMIGPPLLTDVSPGEWTATLISSCGRDFLCYLKSGSVLKHSSRLTQQARVCGAFATLLFLFRADYESAGRRCWGSRELVRFGAFYYGSYSVLVVFSWGSSMASFATITQWNTTTLGQQLHTAVCKQWHSFVNVYMVPAET